MGFPPLIFQSVAVEKVWGGSLLAGPGERRHIGEVWQVSDYPERRTTVSGGVYDGQTLNTLLQRHSSDILGEAEAGYESRFPLLLKLIHSQARLSLQVHPSSELAALIGAEDGGKEEAWLVLDTKPGARIALGIRKGVTRGEFLTALQKDRADDVVNWIVVHTGDFIPIPAGAVHAVDAGLLLMEIQQTSDATYRLHDWGRTGRELHIGKALQVMDDCFQPAVMKAPRFGLPDPIRYTGRHLDVCVERFSGVKRLKYSSCVVLFAAEGMFEVSNSEGRTWIHKHGSVLLAANPPTARIEGEGLLLVMQSR